jgi:hypothetical protein
MSMRQAKMFLLVVLLLNGGMVNANSVMTTNEAPSSENTVANQSSPEPKKRDAQTQIEQAADHFDAFTLQMPKVISAKFESFMKHGFRAVFLDDPETKPAEEKMIDSLVKGLQALGNSLSEDLSQPKSISKAEEQPVKK